MNFFILMSGRHIAWKSAILASFAIATIVAAQQVASAPQNPSIDVRAYNIDVTLEPGHHSITAQATVTFTALQNLTTVAFQLNPALKADHITDEAGHSLVAKRDAAEASVIDITPSIPLEPNQQVTWTFSYNGIFDQRTNKIPNAKDAASVPLAFVSRPASYLLYPARWFPLVGYLTDRFTASIHVHVPAGEQVFGSGVNGMPHPDNNGLIVFDFDWPHSGFPGTIIAGKFRAPYVSVSAPRVHVYLMDEQPSTANGTPEFSGKGFASIAHQEFNFFTSRFGPVDSNQLNVIELPSGTLPAYWAPEIAAIASDQMRGRNASRLLANTLAHQWWGNDLSPATLNDTWITDGMCRHAELEYLKLHSESSVFAGAIRNVSASALAYDTVPLSNMGDVQPFSNSFQARAYDKGAMIFRMLQWQIGDRAFQQMLHEALAQGGKSISSKELEVIAKNVSHRKLGPFFSQWLDSTGAPTYRNSWTLFRQGNGSGFHTVGEIGQDLDLFRMPVEIRVETKNKTIDRRVMVVGPQSQYNVDTISAPKKISLDPDRYLLRNSEEMQIRIHILRGRQLANANDFAGAIQEYRQALAIDGVSSLASFRLGEAYFKQHNYQAAADAFRDALHGDNVPKWIEVWSDVNLGKIFDAMGQRTRAVNQYREALQTRDNTGGALDLAGRYLQHAYRPTSQLEP